MNKTIERLVVGGVALLIGLLLGWTVRGLATYNTSLETAAMYDDWRTVCPAPKTKDVACEMSQDIQDIKSGSTVARIAITKDKGKEVIGFTLPFDVALEPGIGLQVGKDPMRPYKYRTCNGVGCIVVAPADDKLITSISGATDMKLFFLGANAEAKPVAMAISTKGFATARKAYLSGEAKRSSWFWRLWS